MSERNGPDQRGYNSIVPEQEERIGQRRTVPVSRDKPRSNGGGGGANGVWKTLLVVLLIGVGGVGWFAWQQYQQLNTLQRNFDDLNARLASTDESLSQSGTALQLKIREQGEELDKHWVEIKKLWGISYDRNRKQIEANTKAASGNAARLAKMENLATTVSEVKKQLELDSKKIADISSNALVVSADMEDIQQRLRNVVDKLSALDRAFNQWRSGVDSRLKKNEEALDSIDAYRRQINQELLQLRQKLSGTDSGDSAVMAPAQ